MHNHNNPSHLYPKAVCCVICHSDLENVELGSGLELGSFGEVARGPRGALSLGFSHSFFSKCTLSSHYVRASQLCASFPAELTPAC